MVVRFDLSMVKYVSIFQVELCLGNYYDVYLGEKKKKKQGPDICDLNGGYGRVFDVEMLN